MPSIRLSSPSKINLHLRVAGPDASGFHPLRSWLVTTDLADTLTCTLDDASERTIRLRCSDPKIPADARNLVVRAAHSYLDAIAARPLAMHFDLVKRIPSGAGLGGGSGNAATTLVALQTLLGGNADLAAIAATLGSDVPFFLGTPNAVATGRGERLTPAATPTACWALLIFPPFGIPTPACYAMLDRQRPIASSDTLDPFDVNGWSKLEARDLSRYLVNDLEPPAFAIEPSLGTRCLDLERTLTRSVRMSGSGSTLFVLFDDRDEAIAAGKRAGDSSTVVRLGSAAIGPI